MCCNYVLLIIGVYSRGASMIAVHHTPQDCIPQTQVIHTCTVLYEAQTVSCTDISLQYCRQ